MHNLFNIGDEVCPKLIGFPGKGRVAGLILAELFILLNPNKDYNLFDNLYPDWRSGICYYISFKEKRKTTSLSDMKIAYPSMLDKDIKDYLKNIPESGIIVYPEEDLEEF